MRTDYAAYVCCVCVRVVFVCVCVCERVCVCVAGGSLPSRSAGVVHSIMTTASNLTQRQDRGLSDEREVRVCVHVCKCIVRVCLFVCIALCLCMGGYIYL